jgi:hypothetical protein
VPLDSRLLISISAAIAMAWACSCTRPTVNGSSVGTRVYVAGAESGVVSVLVPGAGRQVGDVIPAGRAPRQVLPVALVGLLILSAELSPPHHEGLVHVSRGARGWAVRNVALEPDARGVLLAGDGARYAALAYSIAHGAGQAGEAMGASEAAGRSPWCRVALVDAARGTLERVHRVCQQGEVVSALAFANAPDGPTAYATVWTGRPAARSVSRIVAVNLLSGAVRAGPPIDGTIDWIAVDSASGDRAYAVLADTRHEVEEESGQQWLAWVDLRSLRVSRREILPIHVARPTVAPEGTTAYALDPPGERIVEVDLISGTERVVMNLRSPAAAITVTEGWLYVALPRTGDVLMAERNGYRLVASIRVGGHPIGLSLGPRP